VKVLVTGAGGMLGREVVELLAGTAPHVVVAYDHAALDVGDRDAVLQCVAADAPDVVVNCAAYTAVDACETDIEGAFRGNAFAVRNLAQACALEGIRLVTVSTDYVFDGAKPQPYHEWDEPNPQSVYGASKLAGEREAVAALGERATIARTSWVCGRYGANMVKTVLRLLTATDGPLRFVDDQRGCPTFADDLASMLVRLAVERRGGLYHVTNQGAVSWFEFVRAIAAAAGHDPARVEPISGKDLDPPRPAPRPANSVLDNLALRCAGVELLPHWHTALERTLDALASG
jgi:dTDP-4-dehydrorhamnose reductase